MARPETQALLDGLVEAVPGERLFLLLSYRPEYQHEWSGKKCYTEMRVDPLRPEGAGELLATLLGDAAALEPLKQRLIEKTDGNPFFLEECVRTLVEVGVLAGEPGAYRLARALETIPVPPTVEAVLAARIDRLLPEEKELLQAAAVIGHAVPLPVLQAIAERPEDLLRRGLASLQAAGFLYETTLFPDPEYSFKHALTHEVAYASLLRERRRALHAEIVAALERLFADRLIEFAEGSLTTPSAARSGRKRSDTPVRPAPKRSRARPIVRPPRSSIRLSSPCRTFPRRARTWSSASICESICAPASPR